MGLLSAISFASLVLSPAQLPTRATALSDAQSSAAKLTSRTERSVAFLVIAQAQNALKDKAGALISLETGWKSWTKGSDKTLTEGDLFDLQWLVDKGDISTVPSYYAIEFLYAGNKARAVSIADSYGDSDLGKSYRQSIGLMIRDRFPDDFEEIAYTKTQQDSRRSGREKLLAEIGAIRSEADPAKRADKLMANARALTDLGDPGDGLRVLRESLDLAPQLKDFVSRSAFEAQGAMLMWQMGARVDAKYLIAHASLLINMATGKKKEVLDARFAVEQTKRTMGLPNTFAQVIKDMDVARGIITPPAPEVGGKQDPSAYAILQEATKLHELGNDVAARKTLAKIKSSAEGTLGKKGWWLVLAGELQIAMGDRVPAKGNFKEGAKLYIASLKPAKFMPTEEIEALGRISDGLVQAWDGPGAIRILKEGIAKLSAGDAVMKVMHSGDGGNHMVAHDRKSPILHWGAEALARLGDFGGAIVMARSIPHQAHRAIALAGVVRDFQSKT